MHQQPGEQLTPMLQHAGGASTASAEKTGSTAPRSGGSASKDRYDASVSSTRSSGARSPEAAAASAAASPMLPPPAVVPSTNRAASRAALDRPLTADVPEPQRRDAGEDGGESAEQVCAGQGCCTSPADDGGPSRRVSFGIGGKATPRQQAGADGEQLTPSPYHRFKETFRQQRGKLREGPEEGGPAGDGGSGAGPTQGAGGQIGRMSIPKLNLLNAMVPAKDGDPGALCCPSSLCLLGPAACGGASGAYKPSHVA